MSDQRAIAEREAKARFQQQQEIVKAYKRALATDSGQIMLADLLERFGFDKDGIEKDDFTPGMDALTIVQRTTCKSPIRYMLRMKNLRLKPLGERPRQRKAKSGLASED